MLDVPVPPVPLVTRWATWLEAVNSYGTHFDDLKRVVDMFSPKDSAVKEAQEIFKDCTVAVETQLVKAQLVFLAQFI